MALEKEESYYEIRRTSKDLDPLSYFVALVIGFILINYIWWFVGAFVAFGFLLWYEYYMTVLTILGLYLPFFFYPFQYKDGLPWPIFRNQFFFRLFQKIHNCHIVRTEALDPSKLYIFGVSPHGIMVLSRLAMYGGVFEELFPGLDHRALGASAMFWVPLCREICMWCGAIDAGRKTAEYNLKKNRSLLIWPGGVKEIFLTEPNTKDTKIILKRRKGMIRLSMIYGADLVPTVVFGEKHLYHRVHFSKAVSDFFHRFSIPLLVFWGRWFTWLPLERDFSLVFGKPLPVEKNENPTEKEVDELHEKFINAMKELHDQHKGNYEYSKDDTLTIL